MSRRGSSVQRQGWDPLLIISQIVALQACHYLILALITPPLLFLFTNPTALSLEGGPSNVAMIMDWREMVGKATIEEKVGDYTRLPASLGRQRPPWKVPVKGPSDSDSRVTAAPALNEHEVKESLDSLSDSTPRAYTDSYAAADPIRGWVLGAAWLGASTADILYIYHLIRRPTHILDFSVTLVVNHTVLTTYYASSFPTSLFFWAIIAGAAAMQIIWAEQLCVRREMKEGFILGQGWKTDERAEDLPTHLPRRQRRNSAPSTVRIPMIDVGSGGGP